MGSTLSKQGKKAFESAYVELRDSVFWYINKRVSSRELAEDMTADVFIKLVKNEEILLSRDLNGIKAWLLTVARNTMIDHFRKSSTKNAGKSLDLESEVFEILSSTDTDYLEEAIADERCKSIYLAMSDLSSMEKEVITLRFKEDLQFSEIAQVLSKNEGSVKMIAYRALKKIRNKVNI